MSKCYYCDGQVQHVHGCPMPDVIDVGRCLPDVRTDYGNKYASASEIYLNGVKPGRGGRAYFTKESA